MTRISEIHGISIPSDEIGGRAANVSNMGPVPYLALTAGEMRLWLAAQVAKARAQYYGSDAPQYQRAYTMIENALNAGAHDNKAFVGAIPDNLQPIAQLIAYAQRDTAPASKAVPFVRPKISGINADVIPAQQRLLACLNASQGNFGKVAKCYKAFNIETIINKHIGKGAHHMLYKSLPNRNTLPTSVAVKVQLHELGYQGMAQIGNINDYSLMNDWIEAAIVINNIQGGVGDLNSVISSYQLAPDPEAAKIQYGINDFGITAALAGLLIAAIGLCKKWLTDLQKVDLYALVEARGFGTPGFSANEDDWKLLHSPTEDDNTLILLAAAAAGLYLLND